MSPRTHGPVLGEPQPEIWRIADDMAKAENRRRIMKIEKAETNQERIIRLHALDLALIREERRELKADHFVLELHREHMMLKDCSCSIAQEWRGTRVTP